MMKRSVDPAETPAQVVRLHRLLHDGLALTEARLADNAMAGKLAFGPLPMRRGMCRCHPHEEAEEWPGHKPIRHPD